MLIYSSGPLIPGGNELNRKEARTNPLGQRGKEPQKTPGNPSPPPPSPMPKALPSSYPGSRFPPSPPQTWVPDSAQPRQHPDRIRVALHFIPFPRQSKSPGSLLLASTSWPSCASSRAFSPKQEWSQVKTGRWREATE